MTIEYFFRQLKVSGFECIVDNLLHMQQLRLTGWQYQQEKRQLLWRYDFWFFFRQYTYWFWNDWWLVLQWSLLYKYHSIHQNHVRLRETFVNPYFRRCKLSCPFWQSCKVYRNHRFSLYGSAFWDRSIWYG